VDLDGLKSAFITHLRTGQPEYVELETATPPGTVIIRLSSVRTMEFLPRAPSGRYRRGADVRGVAGEAVCGGHDRLRTGPRTPAPTAGLTSRQRPAPEESTHEHPGPATAVGSTAGRAWPHASPRSLASDSACPWVTTPR
jgi:hypothetical protein